MTISSTKDTKAYLKPGRLADVLALIQVLSLDAHAHRSENGLKEELQGPPTSADCWASVAREHPEFFRVGTVGDHVVSLTARHVCPRNSEGRRDLPLELIPRLLDTAVDLHDRQVRRSERWTVWLPFAASATAAIIALAGVILQILFKTK